MTLNGKLAATGDAPLPEHAAGSAEAKRQTKGVIRIAVTQGTSM
jgi:hypothetical protein